MKLGEMPRYTKDWEGDMYAFHDGEWVRFSDAQAKSLADERRIEELERLLRDSVGWLGPDHPYWDAKEPGTLEHLHERIVAALRVETQEDKP